MSASKSRNELFFNSLSIFVMILTYIFVAVSFADLPDEIPTHFGLDMEVDRLGPKLMIWILPIINTLVLGLSLALRKGEDYVNLPFIKSDKLRSEGLRYYFEMLSSINFMTSLTFAYISYVTVYSEYQSLLPLFITSICFLIFAVIGFYMFLFHKISLQDTQ